MSELGNALKEAREHRNMSIEEVQAITKIQKRYLLAVETGDYHQLPGDFYTRAFIKNYAEAVGLDPEELFDTYHNELPKRHQDVSQLPPRGVKTQKTYHGKPSKFMTFLPKLVVIVLFVGILITIWGLLQKGNGSDNGSTDKGQHVQIKGTIPKSNSTNNEGSSKQKNQQTDNSQNQQKKDQTTAKTQTLKLDRSSGGTSYYTLSNTKTFILDISPINQKANSWVAVREKGPNGKKLFYGMVKTGNIVHLDLTNQKITYVKIGLTPSAVIKINGQNFKFPNNNTTQKLFFTYKKS